jgi:hypothetical protein
MKDSWLFSQSSKVVEIQSYLTLNLSIMPPLSRREEEQYKWVSSYLHVTAISFPLDRYGSTELLSLKASMLSSSRIYVITILMIESGIQYA